MLLLQALLALVLVFATAPATAREVVSPLHTPQGPQSKIYAAQGIDLLA